MANKIKECCEFGEGKQIICSECLNAMLKTEHTKARNAALEEAAQAMQPMLFLLQTCHEEQSCLT